MSTKVMRGYFLEKQSYVDLYAVIIDKKKISDNSYEPHGYFGFWNIKLTIVNVLPKPRWP